MVINDCINSLKNTSIDAQEISFSARASEGTEQVQIWSGFGFQDRDNRYALGLRGGNNNDLYLCRYQSDGKNRMLSLESLDFQPVPGKWYMFKVVFWQDNIRVYLNNEKRPRIVTKDDDYLKGGSPWRGQLKDVPEQMVSMGNNIIMSPNSHCYFDHTYEKTSTMIL